MSRRKTAVTKVRKRTKKHKKPNKLNRKDYIDEDHDGCGKQGWLDKYSPRHGLYCKRFFVEDHGVIYYYAKLKDNSCAGVAPRGHCDLAHMEDIESENSTTKFTLKFGNGVRIKLKARTRKERKEWVS
mmetsp:Transcript_21156/g.23619  ORF Transcript_21156/g.23619 Transcript_21156/m.23619 type:complete len:128 (-) Transcript_21156:347-730(-)